MFTTCKNVSNNNPLLPVLQSQAIIIENIQWNLNPANAPHFGGLWEAGVKSTKHHLKRMLNTKLTYEGFNTLICQIEAILNSRPLFPLSENPEDLEVLTPGHFLIGQPSNLPPEPSLLATKLNRLNQFQYIQRLMQQFWKRWANEYLHRLQQRPKWVQEKPNIEPGNIVIIKDDNLPPAQWMLGRVLKIYPGQDQLVRVADIQCKSSILKRPIHKLCLLPITESIDESLEARE